MSYQNIIVETKGRVGVIQLNRPQALNALNRALIEELTSAIDAFEADDAIGCMLMTGSDKAFAAGADIKEMADKTFIEAYLGNFAADWHAPTRARKPIVAAVAGFALGGGCELAMQCDLIIAADNAKFGQPEIKLGVIPGIGGTQRLTRAVGKAKAMDLILTGRMMDAAEAERCKPGGAGGPGREPDGRSDEGRRHHRQYVVAVGAGGQGVGQRGVRIELGRRRPLRAADFPFAVCDRGSEGRHEGLRREAKTGLEEQVICQIRLPRRPTKQYGEPAKAGKPVGHRFSCTGSTHSRGRRHQMSATLDVISARK